MLKSLRQGQRWVTTLFIVAIGGVFVFFMGLNGPLQRGASTVVQVGPDSYGLREFGRLRSSREALFQEQLGDDYDPAAMSDTLDDVTVRGLIDQAILAQEARELGIAVAKKEIERSILAVPIFRDEGGRFNQSQYEDWANYEFGNERNFIREQRASMLTNKLLRTLTSLSRVSEGEARAAVTRRMEEVQIAFLALDSTAPPEGFEPAPTAIDAFLTSHEPEIGGLYEERSSLYNLPEQVRASHILLTVPTDASDEAVEEVRQRAQQILDRIRAGEDLATLAEELSEDPGTKSQGGDLGFFGRGQVWAEFEEAAFSLEPGSVGDLVTSSSGYHVIRVEERRDAQQRSFDEVKREIAVELLGREAAVGANRATADRLAAAIRDGASLEEVARQEELPITRSGRLRRRPDGFVLGLGAAQELMAAAFTMEPGQSSDRVFQAGERLALLQLIDRFPPDEAAVEAQVEPERIRLAEQKSQAYVSAWIDQRRAELTANGELTVNLKALTGDI